MRAAETGRVYKIAGGAPLWLSSCNAGCGSPQGVNQRSIDSRNHLRSMPVDWTVLKAVESGSYWVVYKGHRYPWSATPKVVVVNSSSLNTIPR